MTDPTSADPRTRRATGSEAGSADIDARILEAEQRLMAREHGLQLSVQGLGMRLRHSLHPRRLLVPALGLGATLAGMLWMLGRRRRSIGPAQGLDPAPPLCTPRQVGHWVPLVGLLWPLLPEAWRARVNPAVARLALDTGLPLFELLFARSGRAAFATKT